MQRCRECGRAQYPPREVCGACLSDALEWESAEALPARVLAHTVLHHSNAPPFKPLLPLTTGLVRLDAGPVAVVFLAGGAQAGDAATVRERDDGLWEANSCSRNYTQS
ncbi:MAG: hypothetical protein JSR21_11375 [Proteobacteria bacterium]|nr:hypothetical protein [Pseudomonadota bacterium]